MTFLPTLALLLLAAISVGIFIAGRNHAIALSDGRLASLHSRPSYHGLYCLLWSVLIGLAVYVVVSSVGANLVDSAARSAALEARPDILPIEVDLIVSDARALASGGLASQTDDLRQAIAAQWGTGEAVRLWAVFLLTVAATGGTAFYTYRQIAVGWRARNRAERVITGILVACAVIAILTTVGIVLSLVGETLNFFNNIGWRVDKFVFGVQWSPLSGVTAGKLDPDQVGAVPLFLGTIIIMLIAMLVAVPIGLFAAIYLADFAPKPVRAWAKPMLEVLAGIPTVVYGFFAALTVAPAIRGAGEAIGLSVASESALAAGVVMGIMIIPFISSLSDDVLNAVPQSLRDGSYGLGATKAETVYLVVLPAALPGIVSAVLLGVSRALGETMIVVMAAGQGANLSFNPLDAVTTVTVQIVQLITGDTEASVAAGPAFTLGFALFVVTLGLNVVALRIVRKYREMYD